MLSTETSIRLRVIVIEFSVSINRLDKLPPEGFEPPLTDLEGPCAIQLHYGGKWGVIMAPPTRPLIMQVMTNSHITTIVPDSLRA